jgi:hypothetical protein
MAVRTRRFKVVEGPAAGARPPRLESSLLPEGAMPVPPSGERVEGQNRGACPPDATKSPAESSQRDVKHLRTRSSCHAGRNPLLLMDLGATAVRAGLIAVAGRGNGRRRGGGLAAPCLPVAHGAVST